MRRFVFMMICAAVLSGCGCDWGINDTASLYLNKIHISSDGEILTVIGGGLIKECEIPGTAPTDDWYY